MIVIGLTGYARCGKDTVADYLVEHHGFEKRRFSDPLKAMLRRLNPAVPKPGRLSSGVVVRVEELYMTYGDEEGIKASPYGDEMRGLWQRLGTDCVRAVDEEFWVRAAMNTLDERLGGSRYVFTDCRFPNEADAVRDTTTYAVESYVGGRPVMVKANTGELWHITRPGVDAVNGHVSEAWAGRMGEDRTIRNDGTIEDLHANVEAALAATRKDTNA